MMKNLRPFHLAIPVKEIKETRAFYREVMGFSEGRSSNSWVDFNFYGHQVVIHKTDSYANTVHNPVDGHHVPVPHFGVVLSWEDWKKLSKRLKEHNVVFEIEPYTRFEGKPGEQATMFFKDPSGNALEFKAFKNEEEIFKQI